MLLYLVNAIYRRGEIKLLSSVIADTHCCLWQSAMVVLQLDHTAFFAFVLEVMSQFLWHGTWYEWHYSGVGIGTGTV